MAVCKYRIELMLISRPLCRFSRPFSRPRCHHRCWGVGELLWVASPHSVSSTSNKLKNSTSCPWHIGIHGLFVQLLAMWGHNKACVLGGVQCGLVYPSQSSRSTRHQCKVTSKACFWSSDVTVDWEAQIVQEGTEGYIFLNICLFQYT